MLEKSGALPSNVYDAWQASRADVAALFKGKVTGPLSRPDIYTDERAKDVNDLTDQFFEGRIDLALLTKLCGGVPPSKKRSLDGQSSGGRLGEVT